MGGRFCFYFMCMCVFRACMSVHQVHELSVEAAEEGIGSSGSGVMNSC